MPLTTLPAWKCTYPVTIATFPVRSSSDSRNESDIAVSCGRRVVYYSGSSGQGRMLMLEVDWGQGQGEA